MLHPQNTLMEMKNQQLKIYRVLFLCKKLNVLTPHTPTHLCHTFRYTQIGFSDYSYLGDQYQIQQPFLHSLAIK